MASKPYNQPCYRSLTISFREMNSPLPSPCLCRQKANMKERESCERTPLNEYSMPTQLVDGLLTDLLQVVRFLLRVYTGKLKPKLRDIDIQIYEDCKCFHFIFSHNVPYVTLCIRTSRAVRRAMNCVVELVKSCQLVVLNFLTTQDKQCEHNLLMAC